MEDLSPKTAQIIEEAIGRGIEKHVNGKIRTLREEVNAANAVQFAKLDELLEIFNDTTGFFKVTVRIAKWITIVGGAIGLVWVGISKLRI